MTAPNEETRWFCPMCFADDKGGSWGDGTIPDAAHCMNCGAGGLVPIPEWAVSSIRFQASWVGKRYYPHDEDRIGPVKRDLDRTFGELGPNAQKVLVEIAKRMAMGAKQYGDFPARKWTREAAEEALDQSVYLAAELVLGEPQPREL